MKPYCFYDQSAFYVIAALNFYYAQIIFIEDIEIYIYICIDLHTYLHRYITRIPFVDAGSSQAAMSPHYRTLLARFGSQFRPKIISDRDICYVLCKR